LMQTRCSILLSIATKRNTKPKMHSCKNNACSQHDVTWQWCNRLAEVWPWPPLSSYFMEAVTTITVRELSDSPSYSSVKKKKK
jgi:hypothetical protein